VATVLIIGASRGIGLETVRAALEAGHSVRALARSARRIAVDHPKLKKMAGDALEMATVKRALSGADVVKPHRACGTSQCSWQVGQINLSIATAVGEAPYFLMPTGLRRAL